MSMVVSTMPPTTRVATLVTDRDYHLSPTTTITTPSSTKSGTRTTITVRENTTKVPPTTVATTMDYHLSRTMTMSPST
jgi:hypothetical protein